MNKLQTTIAQGRRRQFTDKEAIAWMDKKYDFVPSMSEGKDT